jgi:hypothetical protein
VSDLECGESTELAYLPMPLNRYQWTIRRSQAQCHEGKAWPGLYCASSAFRACSVTLMAEADGGISLVLQKKSDRRRSQRIRAACRSDLPGVLMRFLTVLPCEDIHGIVSGFFLRHKSIP